MFKHLNTNTLNWILIIGVILFIIELTFFHGGMIASALFCALFIYIGWKNFHQLWGKIFFWFGIAGAAFSILNMLAVRFLIIAAIILFIMNYSKSKKNTEVTYPTIPPNQKEDIADSAVLKVEPLFDNSFFKGDKTDDSAYHWRDVNIHGIIGDRVIDLSNTVLPNDTAVISIRHVAGNIEIYVPYDIEVSILHSSFFGRAQILDQYHTKLMNRSLIYKTEKYDESQTRVKIITSIFSGDIEVKRI
ncbi:cell wall-active antibiotics response protein LiaF [Virgibacillus halodenitrificans]|uniref:cell wall-active antibiotics response protein LiaF n=1 Tax=Virgibacillus halodenitrificans TaxID=1482 RepID=UPI001FB27D1E|nr:cell wall-active antibiotics response protein LiaF [Virgibacillus halodenitrificans]MCJ0932672.1 cell wall-active antibiotics response protein LiaF [Virgibacillus halodenitrificans]